MVPLGIRNGKTRTGNLFPGNILFTDLHIEQGIFLRFLFVNHDYLGDLFVIDNDLPVLADGERNSICFQESFRCIQLR